MISIEPTFFKKQQHILYYKKCHEPKILFFSFNIPHPKLLLNFRSVILS